MKSTFTLGRSRVRRSAHLDAAHARHRNVGDDEGGAQGQGDLEALLSVESGQDAVAGFAELKTHQLHHVRLVVHYQNPVLRLPLVRRPVPSGALAWAGPIRPKLRVGLPRFLPAS